MTDAFDEFIGGGILDARVIDLAAIPELNVGICFPLPIPEAEVRFDLDLATPGWGILDGLGEAVLSFCVCVKSVATEV